MKHKLLIVDDDLGVRESLRELLDRDFFITTAVCGKEAKELWQKEIFDLVILDILLPDTTGIDLLKILRNELPDVPVIMITGTREVNTAVNAMKMGAFDYITKPFVNNLLVNTINKALQLRNEQHNTVKWIRKSQEEVFFGNLVGASQKMMEVFNRIAQLMHTSTTVLIEGESGTGKELIARAIHFHGTRRNNPFVPVHIASLSEGLLESELFGHEKGAFTGAVKEKPGSLELADQGTVFFDEVGDIPGPVQAKLLRVLQEREFRRVGGIKNIKVDVRFIAAANRPLRELVEEGIFREDLYYRIDVVKIVVPPLRERPLDVPVLAYHFLKKSREHIKSKVNGFTNESIELLKRYNWPGNIRELKNLVEQIVTMADNEWVTPKDLPVHIQKGIAGTEKLEDSVSLYERRLIEEALIKTNGGVTAAAELLGITKRILRYRMEKLGINVGAGSKPALIGPIQ